MTARIYQFPLRARDLLTEGACALPSVGWLVEEEPPPVDQPPDEPVSTKSEPAPRGAE